MRACTCDLAERRACIQITFQVVTPYLIAIKFQTLLLIMHMCFFFSDLIYSDLFKLSRV